jgi:hypothetical protein
LVHEAGKAVFITLDATIAGIEDTTGDDFKANLAASRSLLVCFFAPFGSRIPRSRWMKCPSRFR